MKDKGVSKIAIAEQWSRNVAIIILFLFEDGISFKKIVLRFFTIGNVHRTGMSHLLYNEHSLMDH